MLIEARRTPLEVILCLRAFDCDGVLIDRLVYLDTEKKVAKQYLLDADASSTREITVGRFYFVANDDDEEQLLQKLLPKDLCWRIVRT